MEELMRLAGAHEVKQLLGVSRQRVYQLAARSDFPKPVAALAQGKVWLLGDIEQWAAARQLLFGKDRGKSFDEQVRDLSADYSKAGA
jgi:predicted DNA-binding transcriptional regulator AlpA